MGNLIMGNCFGRGSTETDGLPSSRTNVGTFQQVLMFPDREMPCRYGKQCRRGASCTYSHDNTSLKKFLSHLSSAKRSVDVCVFTITCNEIADTLLDLHKSNVRVRVISDGEQLHSQGSDVQRLARAGVPVRLGGSQQSHMHHKFAVIDGSVVVTGSFNWTRQAVLKNNENMLISNVAGIQKPFVDEFEKLWRELSSRVLT